MTLVGLHLCCWHGQIWGSLWVLGCWLCYHDENMTARTVCRHKCVAFYSLDGITTRKSRSRRRLHCNVCDMLVGGAAKVWERWCKMFSATMRYKMHIFLKKGYMWNPRRHEVAWNSWQLPLNMKIGNEHWSLNNTDIYYTEYWTDLKTECWAVKLKYCNVFNTWTAV